MKTAMQLMEELGLHEGGAENWIPGNAWETFAELIRADEREAAEERVVDLFTAMQTPYLPDITRAIRARGNT